MTRLGKCLDPTFSHSVHFLTFEVCVVGREQRCRVRGDWDPHKCLRCNEGGAVTQEGGKRVGRGSCLCGRKGFSEDMFQMHLEK